MASSKRRPAPAVVREVEATFDVPEGFTLPELTGVDGVAGLEQGRAEATASTYRRDWCRAGRTGLHRWLTR